MESEKKRQEREEREKLQRDLEEEEALKTERKVRREMFYRKIQLRESGNVFKLYDQIIFDYLQRKKSIHEWEVYTSCGNTPYLNALNEINSYVSSWEEEMKEPTVQKVSDQIPETILFINEMKNFLTFPFDSAFSGTVREIGLIYQKLKKKQEEAIDGASFALIKNLNELFDPEIGVFVSIFKSPKMSHCLWGNMYMCPEYDSYIYEDVKFRFKIPEFLMKVKGIYRLVKLEYDHFSDSSYSYFPPGIHDALRNCKLFPILFPNGSNSTY